MKTKDCGPILIRLSWHDAGVFSDGDLKGGCPNAVMRFTDAGDFATGKSVSPGKKTPRRWLQNDGFFLPFRKVIL